MANPTTRQNLIFTAAPVDDTGAAAPIDGFVSLRCVDAAGAVLEFPAGYGQMTHPFDIKLSDGTTRPSTNLEVRLVTPDVPDSAVAGLFVMSADALVGPGDVIISSVPEPVQTVAPQAVVLGGGPTLEPK